MSDVSESERQPDSRWASLPTPTKPDEMTATHPVSPGADSTPDVDLERYWTAQEQG